MEETRFMICLFVSPASTLVYSLSKLYEFISGECEVCELFMFGMFPMHANGNGKV